MKLKSLLAVFFLTIASVISAKGQALILEGSCSGTVPCQGSWNMPAYNDTSNIGCAPTSIAMVLAYYSLRYGDTNLFPGITGTSLYLTNNVAGDITSIALSCSTDATGYTVVGNVLPGLINFASGQKYAFSGTLTRIASSGSLWNVLENNINAGKPMLFWVDSNNDGTADHIVPVFGYDNNHLLSNGTYGPAYACYTTGNENEIPVWESFQFASKGSAPIQTDYGIGSEIQINQIVPEPKTILCVILGALILILRQRRKSRSFY